MFGKKKKEVVNEVEMELTEAEVAEGSEAVEETAPAIDSIEEERVPGVVNDAEDLMWEVIDEFTRTKTNMLSNIRKNKQTRMAFMDEVSLFLQKYYKQYSDLFEEATNLIESYIFGYYRLTPLIEDPDISDIKILDYNNIRIKKNGKRYPTDIKFKNKKEYENFVNYVATKNQVNISNINALQIFSDNSSNDKFILRFVISMPIITMTGMPYMAIRKVARDFPEMDDLVAKGMMDDHLKDYLIERFKKHSMLVCGPSASGKTTLLNALKETAPDDSSCLVVQETEELTAKRHPDMLFEHPVINRGESKVQYQLYDIIAAGLLMDIERFIVGEVKGAEAIYLLNASYTAHICAATIHAESARVALDKLVDYAKYGSDYSKNELMKMVCAFKTIVFIRDFAIAEIVEVEGWDPTTNEVIYKPVYVNEEELYV